MEDEEEDEEDEDDAAGGGQGDIKKDPDAPEPSTSVRYLILHQWHNILAIATTCYINYEFVCWFSESVFAYLLNSRSTSIS